MVNRRYDIITFDCYGTLIDWDGGISDAFRAAAAVEGVPLDLAAALAAYAEIEPVVQAETFRSYREVLTESARRTADRLGWRLAPARAGFLPDSLPGWKPFADTNPALQRLAAAGYRLGILSNVDDDLLAGTRRHLSVPFDLIVTAQQVRSYKPGHAHFTTARERMAGARWLHAAQSYFHDVVPARALGIPVAWINRKGEAQPEASRADMEIPRAERGGEAQPEASRADMEIPRAERGGEAQPAVRGAAEGEPSDAEWEARSAPSRADMEIPRADTEIRRARASQGEASPDGGRPTRELRTLAELADWLE